MRFGLCCQFVNQSIRFRTTTAAAVSRLARGPRIAKISEICLHNANALHDALRYCQSNGIGAFRVRSELMPLRTHPQAGYDLEELPDFRAIAAALRNCRTFARSRDIRLTFHPDQFVVLSSPHPAVVESSMRELEHHGEVAARLGADVINIHAGGGYGDKPAALRRFAASFARLSRRVRSRLTVENDDFVFTVSDLLPLCRKLVIPLVYDVHHHRCNADGLSVPKATDYALATWDREPLFHISSPKYGWNGPTPRCHHDYVKPRDLPGCWLNRDITVEVEAKAKELAVLRLKRAIARRRKAVEIRA